MEQTCQKVIGLIPAGGKARRISPLPMSKELFPLGFFSFDGALRPKVAAQYLLERLRNGGVHEAFFILRPGKWDIPAYFGDGATAGVKLAYLTVHNSLGVPFTLDQAYPFVRDQWVAFGFPDILFWPDHAYATLVQRLRDSNADAVLGLFPTDEPEKVGVVQVDERGCVQGIFEKSDRTDLSYMWAIAVWKPSLTEYLHLQVQDTMAILNQKTNPRLRQKQAAFTEVPMGDILHTAIEAGLRVEAEVFQGGHYVDIGTPENLRLAILGNIGTDDTA